MQSSRNYWKFPLSSGRTATGVELRGEINKVVKHKLNTSSVLAGNHLLLLPFVLRSSHYLKTIPNCA